MLEGTLPNDLVRIAVHRVDPDATGYSTHSLRAGFVTYAYLRGASDRAIAASSAARRGILGQHLSVGELDVTDIRRAANVGSVEFTARR